MRFRSITALLVALLLVATACAPLVCAASCGTAMRAAKPVARMSAEGMAPCPMSAGGLPGEAFVHRDCCAHAACAGLPQATANAITPVAKRVPVVVLPVATAGFTEQAHREGRRGHEQPALWRRPPPRSSRPSRSSLADRSILRV